MNKPHVLINQGSFGFVVQHQHDIFFMCNERRKKRGKGRACIGWSGLPDTRDGGFMEKDERNCPPLRAGITIKPMPFTFDDDATAIQ
jgi:hypothetical protein